ncbi:SDR family NAD(P)-dependent oxidoreductase, partial [Pyxidicoccus fallax]|uniref:SDR family NAD(P)-dependent oxidoreductase n=1 Tax=Pyxidicoccus fallax TaxID=394095 RepID=UPI001B7D5287
MSTELNLAGERPLALITGASAGIGREIATQFAAHGYDLALVSRRRERLLDVAAVLADCYEVDALVIDADLSSRDGPSEVLSRLRALDRHVDALVN